MSDLHKKIINLPFLSNKVKQAAKGNGKVPTGEIGLELEMEGDLKLPQVDDPFKYWEFHHEASLKDGGGELVLKAPVDLIDLDVALAELKQGLAKSKIKQSLRTSTHIHYNVLNFTLYQVYAILGAFYLVEDALINTQGPNRKGNLFCLALSDAEDILWSMLDDHHQEDYFANSGHIQRRYAAQNLAAVRKFGSIEYRFLKGTTNFDEIKMWCEELYSFVHTAKNLSWKEVKDLTDLTPFALLKKFFSTKMIKYVMASQSPETLANAVMENADLVHVMYNRLHRYSQRSYKLNEGVEDDVRYTADAHPEEAANVAQPVGGFTVEEAQKMLNHFHQIGVKPPTWVQEQIPKKMKKDATMLYWAGYAQVNPPVVAGPDGLPVFTPPAAEQPTEPPEPEDMVFLDTDNDSDPDYDPDDATF